MLPVEIRSEMFAQACYVNSQVPEQSHRFHAVHLRRRKGLRAAIAENDAITDAELIAPGVAAKIVVILQNENPGFRSGNSSEKPRR